MARVLVVDDDPAVLGLVADFLAARGHQVLRATNGAEAREVIDRARKSDVVEVLVTDLQMPVLDGLALLAHVRATGNPIPTIVVSGSWTDEQRDRARELGAARLLPKPVDLAQLARDVQELVR